ncbi:restriction endonuclease subunit S [Aquabacterium sp. A7-Y]|uniref:restriction endonuclease subunit S n=1 Tax=Aquabacterium sp. A7-Y TaxID=1349605 RepID=UPI00223D7125|nr:restriction endonuclease subunit S [Aquabacterium sp. A7-Y]MCW7540478.1 restriction endonuclease subunit S [Aquabacterium sp. A7-Y]
MSEPWKEATIAQCLATSFAGEWGTEPKPGNALVFRATDIDDEGRIVGNGAERRLPIGKLTAKRLQDGDILLEGSGGGPDKPVGRVAYFAGDDSAGPAVCSNFFKTLRPARDRVDSRFLLRKLAWFYKQAPILALQQQTTGIINLKFEEYLASPITVPLSIAEQSTIAHVLDTLDTAIHETEAIIAKLKAVKQGLLHDLLTRGIDANGELRPPQAEAPHLYKPSPLGWIPKEWDVVLLDRVAVRGSGHTPSKSIPSYWNGGIKWVSLADSHRLDNIYIDETDKEISVLGIANSSAVLHTAGTVVLSRDAGVGKSAVLARDMAVSQHFMAWRCGDQLNNLFLYFYLQREKPRFEAIALGSTVKTIGLSFFKSYMVALPSRAEQDQAVTSLMSMERNLSDHLAEVDKLRDFKLGIMDDLLTGRVRVTPLLEATAA